MRLVSTVILVLAVACALIGTCRWIARRHPAAGLIVQVGLAVRLWAGLGLFWISYLDLPLLQQLQSGGGFWLLAPDARNYFDIAARAADAGMNSVPGWSPSPAFTRTLGLWMRLVGVSPASGLLLNALAYVGVAALIVGIGARHEAGPVRRLRLVPLVAFSFSPALVLFGTQTLKDQFFCFVLAVACAASWALFRVFSSASLLQAWRSGTVALVIVASATYVLAGIRPYVPFLMMAAMALVLLAITVRQATLQLCVRNLLVGMVVFAALWIPFREGAGPYYNPYKERVEQIVGIPRGAQASEPAVLGDLARAREGFVESGGATNIVEHIEAPPDAAWVGRAWTAVKQLSTGLVLLVVPVSLLQWLSAVRFDGGRGLLMFTDLDTLFLDVTILAVVLALVRSWRLGRINWPCVLFVAGMCAALAVMMAYVVTNFGTLFRLRLMATTLLWLLPIAMIQPRDYPTRTGSPRSVRVRERLQQWVSSSSRAVGNPTSSRTDSLPGQRAGAPYPATSVDELSRHARRKRFFA